MVRNIIGAAAVAMGALAAAGAAGAQGFSAGGAAGYAQSRGWAAAPATPGVVGGTAADAPPSDDAARADVATPDPAIDDAGARR